MQSQKMEALGRLAGGVAHDFNNLLTAISGYASMVLAELPLDSSIRNDVTEIWRAAERSASLTRQLLAFSRKQVLDPRLVELGPLVEELLPLLRRLLGEDVDVRSETRSTVPPVLADPGQIEQVVVNLAVNARDAMPDGGRLVLSVGDAPAEAGADRLVRLSVADEGLGMDDETRRRALEPFFTTKEPGRGTGLGLATVYGIVQQSGGRLLLESAPGRGTTVHVDLPPMPGASPQPRRTEPVTVLPKGRGESILVVEDDENVRTLVRRVLEAGGYRPLVASTAPEAIELARAHHSEIRLILSDVVMPGLNGRELADLLEPLLPSRPVVFMSGYTDNVVLRHGVSSEAHAFLEKPFTPDTLLRCVRKLLDSTEGERQQRDPPDVQAFPPSRGIGRTACP